MATGQQEYAELTLFLGGKRLYPLEQRLDVGSSLRSGALKPLASLLHLLDIAKLAPVVTVDITPKGHQRKSVVLV